MIIASFNQSFTSSNTDKYNVLAAGSQTALTQGTVMFSNSNGVTFGMSGNSVITASINSQVNNAVVYALSNTTQVSQTTISLGTLNFRGGGGASVGVSGGSILISTPIGGGTGADGYNIIAAGTETANSATTVQFLDSNGISFGMSDSSGVTASYTVPTDYISTAESSLFQQVSDMSLYQATSQNSLSLGTNYTSHTHSQYLNTSQSSLFQQTSQMSLYQATSLMSNYLTTQSNQAFSASGGSSTFQTLEFVNSNGITFSNTNGSLRASYSVPNDYVSTNQSSLFALTANDSLSLGTGYTTHTHSQYINTSQSSLFAFTSNDSLSLGTNYTTHTHSQYINTSQSSLFQYSSQMTDYLGTAATQSFRFTSDNSELLFTSQSSLFQATSDNSLSLGTGYTTHTHSQYINTSQSSLFEQTSHTTIFLTTAMQSDAGSNFVNTNAGLNLTNISATFNSNSISLSVAAPLGAQTAISGLAISDTTYTSGTASFRDGNGISWASTTGQGISLTHSLQYQSNSSLSLGTGATVSFRHTSADSQLQFTSAMSDYQTTGAYLTTQSAQAFSAGAASSVFQTLSFQDSNGVSFSNNAGAIRLTHALQYTSNTSAITSNALNTSQSSLFQQTSLMSNYQTTGNYLTTARASNDAIGLNTAQSNVTWTVNSSGLSLDARGYAGTGTSATNASITLNSNGLAISVGAGGGVTPVASASNGSFSFTTLAFSNANNVTFGTSAGSIITASINPGAAAENNNFNLLGANTAGNTTASGSTIGLSGINMTLSGTNGSIINMSVPATSSLSATGLLSISVNGSTISMGVPGASTYSGFNPYADIPMVAGQIGNGTIMFEPELFPDFNCDRVVFLLNNTNSSNSSGSHTLSFYVGVYTRTESTLSLYTSVSQSTAITHSGTAGSYSLYSGMRMFTIGMTNTFTAGEYWLAMLSRTTSGGANGSYSNYLGSNINSNLNGFFGSSNNGSYQLTLGQGFYSVTSSSLPSSVGFSQLIGSGSNPLRPPIMIFANSTI